ncbi:3,4-dihydroxy-2-butanone-4-phosphate synthase [Rhodococcus fascians]|nr:3,4-dihydroxy-2-butanone-4-phosphate synthase [Rhodococcus fascians]MBY4238710.1 3,4-dihydroxy-2-butanone-4-phosphate synthase [Rhodococcus fascians]MBY4254701.1 3,4-dihydroxy-2-butanone-4-phosphate synthase [Rhodococcus fascians]MBY4270065.1 3,4-dihydroxy-2-butanone-4-phosphate synthase [Rhodococcus fascians]
MTSRTQTLRRSSTSDVVGPLAKGRPAIFIDEHGDGVLFFAGSRSTVSLLHFAIRHSTGLILALLRHNRLDQLRIPDQPVFASEQSTLKFTVAVDAATGVTTGISAHDRALTLRTLADPTSVPVSFTRPGHVLPVRCDSAGRDSDFSRALDLVTRVDGRSLAAGACHLVADSGETLRGSSLSAFARTHDLVLL